LDNSTESKRHYISMDNKKESREYFNILNIILCISFGLYLIKSFDFFLSYSIFIDIIIGFLLLCLIALFPYVIYLLIKEKQFPTILATVLFFLITSSYILLERNSIEFFLGDKALEASFLDDRSRIDLTLYKNGKYIMHSSWLFGSENFTGKYNMHGDTIEFDKKPLTNNDFIAKTIIRHGDKIYFFQNKKGLYDTEFYYFKIDFDKK
jgi:hypothetical protein